MRPVDRGCSNPIRPDSIFLTVDIVARPSGWLFARAQSCQGVDEGLRQQA